MNANFRFNTLIADSSELMTKESPTSDANLALGLLVFGLTYAAITTDKIHKTIVALGGAVAMLLLGLITQEKAFQSVDWNVIFLLAGMMIIAHSIQGTGFFQWVAIKLVKLAQARPIKVLIYLSTFAAFASAFLDNVTTVVLLTPLILYVARLLTVSAMPYLLSLILASNIGGTATLIGDPPNIIIGSAAGLDFGAFLLNLAPVVLVILGVFLLTVMLLFRKELQIEEETRLAALEIEEKGIIKDRRMLVISLTVLGLTILGFLVQGIFHYEAATIALAGAVLVLLLGPSEVHEVLSEIEWTTLLFFVGLFIVVEAIIEVGFVAIAARSLLSFTGGDLGLTTMLLLWLSGVASGIVDNIPYTATMVPIIKELGNTMPVQPLWWALALGACLGGNATIVGASANVIVASLGERAGYKISFGSFLKYGLLITFESLVIASAYIWLRYL
jgi:Na+/H+ antiporter NhaD/arsenite permease-like protein